MAPETGQSLTLKTAPSGLHTGPAWVRYHPELTGSIVRRTLASRPLGLVAMCALAVFLPVFATRPCWAAPPAQSAASADQLLNQAIDAQQRGDFPAAIRSYRKVVALRPNDVEARVNLGAALAHTGQLDAAIAEYEAALPLTQLKDPLLLNLGLAYYKKGDFKDACDQFEPVLRSQPGNVRVAMLLGDAETHLGQGAAAVALLTPLEAKNSGNPDFEYRLGLALIESGARKEGVDRVEKVAVATNSADAYYLAGSTRSQMNDYQPARHDLDEALRLDPKLPGIYTLAGTARDKTGDIRGAEAAFRSALKLNPNDFDANLYLGAILYKRRDIDEAKGYLDRALQLNPKSSMAIYESAMLKSTTGQMEAAAAELEKVAVSDPDWLEPHVALASLYYRLHRPEDGAKQRQIVDRLTAQQQQQGPRGTP